MASRQEMSDFLASVERRAFKHALFAVRDEETALDLVQDAMLRLAEKYSDKPPAELPLLFQRILQNAVTDHFRRQKIRNLWVSLFSSIFPEDGDNSDRDPLDSLESSGQTGAAWQLAAFDHYQGDRAALLARYVEGQNSGTPVHSWPL